MKTIRHEQGKLPALTEAQQAELQALAKIPQSDIDTGDICQQRLNIDTVFEHAATQY